MSTVSTKTKPAFTRRAIAGALFASAVISTSFPVDAAPLPATSPGAFDPTFNGGATMHQPMFTRDDFAMAVHVQADGKTVMSGYFHCAPTGPNGHFYTISADECAIVKEDAGWKFESYDFSGSPKAVDGHCAEGVAVKRVYNNRFAVNDSNHRYAPQ